MLAKVGSITLNSYIYIPIPLQRDSEVLGFSRWKHTKKPSLLQILTVFSKRNHLPLYFDPYHIIVLPRRSVSVYVVNSAMVTQWWCQNSSINSSVDGPRSTFGGPNICNKSTEPRANYALVHSRFMIENPQLGPLRVSKVIETRRSLSVPALTFSRPHFSSLLDHRPSHPV